MAASSSSNYRGHSAAAYGHAPRSPSPPASAYFPLLSADTNTRLRPTPNAEAHFAYSTTLRRHQSEGAAALASPAEFAAAVNAEATSLWTRAVNTITGRESNDYQPAGNGRETPPVMQEGQAKDTASAKFAHYTIEVRVKVLYALTPSETIPSPRSTISELPTPMVFYTQTLLFYVLTMATTNFRSRLRNPYSSNSLKRFTNPHSFYYYAPALLSAQ